MPLEVLLVPSKQQYDLKVHSCNPNGQCKFTTTGTANFCCMSGCTAWATVVTQLVFCAATVLVVVLLAGPAAT